MPQLAFLFFAHRLSVLDLMKQGETVQQNYGIHPENILQHLKNRH